MEVTAARKMEVHLLATEMFLIEFHRLIVRELRSSGAESDGRELKQ